MSVIVEDGTAKVNSNSYVNEATLTAYATDRGLTLLSSATSLLIRAATYLDTLVYIGNKGSLAQAMQWPRISYSPLPFLGGDQYSYPGYAVYISVDGYIIGPTDIPIRLKNAQCEIALAMDAGYDITAIMTQAVKAEKVGPIEIEYQNNSTSRVYYPNAASLLSPLLKSGVNNLRVGRS